MLKIYYFMIPLLMISIPGVFAAPINSTINTPDEGFSFSAIQNRTNDIAFSEENLQEWNKIINIETPKIQPIIFPIIVMLIFSISLAAALKTKEGAIAGMFFLLSFLMSLVLVLIFSGNLEFGTLEEELKGKVNTSTGLFEISKTYYANKIIPNDATFRPIFTLVFQMLLFFTTITFIVKLFLMPMLAKRKSQNQN